jgi:hypothetical protein
MSEKFRPWVKRKMEAGEYLAWFANAPDESVAAGAGLWLMDWPPHIESAREYCERVYGSGVPEAGAGAGVDEDSDGMVRERRGGDRDPARERRRAAVV